MIGKLLGVVALAIVSILAADSVHADERFYGMDTYVEAAMRAWEVPDWLLTFHFSDRRQVARVTKKVVGWNKQENDHDFLRSH
jgi:fructose-specific component phosphotransferase system IIB-like protein